MISTGI